MVSTGILFSLIFLHSHPPSVPSFSPSHTPHPPLRPRASYPSPQLLESDFNTIQASAQLKQPSPSGRPPLKTELTYLYLPQRTKPTLSLIFAYLNIYTPPPAPSRKKAPQRQGLCSVISVPSSEEFNQWLLTD